MNKLIYVDDLIVRDLKIEAIEKNRSFKRHLECILEDYALALEEANKAREINDLLS